MTFDLFLGQARAVLLCDIAARVFSDRIKLPKTRYRAARLMSESRYLICVITLRQAAGETESQPNGINNLQEIQSTALLQIQWLADPG
jgi:hypothetical protein